MTPTASLTTAAAPMTAEETAKHWHAEFAKGRPLHECFLKAVTTYAAQVRRDTLASALFAAEYAHSGATAHDAISRLQHSYGKGWTNGYQQARSDLLEAIRALSPSPVKAAMVSQWRDISTAPKDEATSFLVRRRGFVIQVSWFEGRLYPDARESCIDWENGITDATHWMPFPLPPSPVKAGGETTTG